MRGLATWYFWGILFLCLSDAAAQTLNQGFADLSRSSFEENLISLSGEWEFYWGKLLKPADFAVDQHPAWVYAPGSWHRQGDYPALGVATYRAQIVLPPDQKDLALFFSDH